MSDRYPTQLPYSRSTFPESTNFISDRQTKDEEDEDDEFAEN